MQQQVVVLSKAQQITQHRLGESLAGYMERRYIADGLTLGQLASELSISVPTASRWLWQFRIEARRPGPKAAK